MAGVAWVERRDGLWLVAIRQGPAGKVCLVSLRVGRDQGGKARQARLVCHDRAWHNEARQARCGLVGQSLGWS